MGRPVIHPPLIANSTHGLLGLTRRFWSRDWYWLCLCACGSEATVRESHIRSGKTKSCGCLVKSINRKLRLSHGCFGTPEYNSWAGMISRCCNPSNRKYAIYGGRGISVCSAWRDAKTGFQSFHDYLGDKPSPKHSLDRFPDVNGNYEPGNVRWATPTEQARNTRKVLNSLISVGTVTLSAREWSEQRHVYVATILRRYRRGVVGEALFHNAKQIKERVAI